jgi:hypothetical protein
MKIQMSKSGKMPYYQGALWVKIGPYPTDTARPPSGQINGYKLICVQVNDSATRKYEG